MWINVSVNNSIARTLAFVHATWKQLHAPTRKGFGGMLAALVAFASCGGCGSDSQPPVTRGSVALAWSIADLNGQPTTCDRVGATTVVLRLRSRAGAASVASFPCANSPGTAQIVAGPYDITPELHASDGTVIARAPDRHSQAVERVAGQPRRWSLDQQNRKVLSLPVARQSSRVPPGGILKHAVVTPLSLTACTRST